MTTNVVVKPANYPTKVTITDSWRDTSYTGDGVNPTIVSESVQYVKAGEERTFYCTTSRTISVVDVEYEEVEGSREAAGIKE